MTKHWGGGIFENENRSEGSQYLGAKEMGVCILMHIYSIYIYTIYSISVYTNIFQRVLLEP